MSTNLESEPQRLRSAPVPFAMLNPAMIALLLHGASTGYSNETANGLPWSLSFIVAPMVLHKGTREALPQRVSTHLPTWVSRHPAIRAGFPQRSTSLAEPVREGTRFGMRCGLLRLVDGRLIPSQSRLQNVDPMLRDLIKKSTFVGRWLSKVDQPSTAFVLFGITV